MNEEKIDAKLRAYDLLLQVLIADLREREPVTAVKAADLLDAHSLRFAKPALTEEMDGWIGLLRGS